MTGFYATLMEDETVLEPAYLLCIFLSLIDNFDGQLCDDYIWWYAVSCYLNDDLDLIMQPFCSSVNVVNDHGQSA